MWGDVVPVAAFLVGSFVIGIAVGWRAARAGLSRYAKWMKGQ
jgi:hypothetical protein